MLRPIAILVCLCASFNASSVLAQWNLDNDRSRLSFVTIKAGNIGEVHRFGSLSGTLSDTGALSVVVQLASVDTLIPIRDERMQQMLFETNLFPTATFSATLDMAEVNDLPIGGSMVMDVTGQLTIRETSATVVPRVMITRFGESGVVVNTLEPLILNADVLGLSEGVEKLREVAGLPSISSAVPTTFVLTLTRS